MAGFSNSNFPYKLVTSVGIEDILLVQMRCYSLWDILFLKIAGFVENHKNMSLSLFSEAATFFFNFFFHNKFILKYNHLQ